MNIGRAVVVCPIRLEDLELSDSTLFQNSHADGVEQIDADIIPDRATALRLAGWDHMYICVREIEGGEESCISRAHWPLSPMDDKL